MALWLLLNGLLSTESALPGLASSTVRPRPVCGVNFAHSWQDQGKQGYGTKAARRSLSAALEHGLTAVALTPFAYLGGLTKAEVVYRPHQRGSESWTSVRSQAQHALDQGVAVFLKPHIWVRGGKFRGHIAPDDEHGGWPEFYKSYRAFMLQQATLAAQSKAEWLALGVELSSAVRHEPSYWASLATAVRQRYPGKLTYCANWDAVESLPQTLWQQVDAVGVQMFAPLSSTSGATMQEEAGRWLNRYRAVAKRAKKPLLVCEVGFMNRLGASKTPWLWPEQLTSLKPTAAGSHEQAAAYDAILNTFGRSPDVVALYWWKWFTNMQTDEEGAVGFVPYGKPAAERLRFHCQSRR